MATHVFHIDDSGTKDYAEDPSTYDRGETRYFAFGGLLTTVDEAASMAQALQRAKSRVVGTENIELKSNWLRMPDERKRRYLDPLGITDQRLTFLVDAAYQVLINSSSMLIASVVDKIHMREDYGLSAYYPPALAYESALQRVQMELRGQTEALIVVDDMTGKNPKGNEHKTNLIRQHDRLRKHGSQLRGRKYPAMPMSAIGALKFRSSARSDMLQLADLVAYNVYRQFRQHGLDWEVEAESLPLYDHFRRMLPRFRSGPGGRIQGYGVVKWPIRQRVAWARTERATP